MRVCAIACTCRSVFMCSKQRQLPCLLPLLQNSVMTNAAMQRVDARGASFDGSNLRGAVLSFARLDNASFARATLTGALFTRAAVNGADFTDAVGVLSANFRSTRGEPIGLDVTTPQRLVRQPIG
eukprot:6174710-Pleurochrysis_carterae.AAC.3